MGCPHKPDDPQRWPGALGPVRWALRGGRELVLLPGSQMRHRDLCLGGHEGVLPGAWLCRWRASNAPRALPGVACFTTSHPTGGKIEPNDRARCTLALCQHMNLSASSKH